jgi:hypothetical protein
MKSFAGRKIRHNIRRRKHTTAYGAKNYGSGNAAYGSGEGTQRMFKRWKKEKDHQATLFQGTTPVTKRSGIREYRQTLRNDLRRLDTLSERRNKEAAKKQRLVEARKAKILKPIKLRMDAKRTGEISTHGPKTYTNIKLTQRRIKQDYLLAKRREEAEQAHKAAMRLHRQQQPED